MGMQIASTWHAFRFNRPFNLHPPNILYVPNPCHGLRRCNNPPVLLISPQDVADLHRGLGWMLVARQLESCRIATRGVIDSGAHWGAQNGRGLS